MAHAPTIHSKIPDTCSPRRRPLDSPDALKIPLNHSKILAGECVESVTRRQPISNKAEQTLADVGQMGARFGQNRRPVRESYSQYCPRSIVRLILVSARNQRPAWRRVRVWIDVSNRSISRPPQGKEWSKSLDFSFWGFLIHKRPIARQAKHAAPCGVLLFNKATSPSRPPTCSSL